MKSDKEIFGKRQLDYRYRIYKDYTLKYQGTMGVFDAYGSIHWGKAYDYYFRGWMPESKEAKILDVACGSGRLLYFFKARGYRKVTGVDISPSQVNLAKRVVPDVLEKDAIAFLESNVDSFDLIVGLDILEHFHKDDALRFLDSCYECLNPGGRLILQTPNSDSPWFGSIRYGDFTHELSFNPWSLAGLMQLCGFRDTEFREQGPVPIGYSVKSTIRFLVWKSIRLGLKVWNIAETGSVGDGIFTRVFLASGRRG